MLQNYIATAIPPEQTMRFVNYFINKFGINRTIAGFIIILIFVVLNVTVIMISAKEKRHLKNLNEIKKQS